jgi:hypothetical protein
MTSRSIRLDPPGSTVDPATVDDIRTPLFDLDCVYGLGPEGSPDIYDGNTGRLRIDHHDGADDLPRDAQGLALIGDPRNDENTAVSQLQLAFLKLHNAVLDHVKAAPQLKRSGESDFAAAQRLTRWLYQWSVVHDFLPRVAGQDVIDDIFQKHGNRPVRTKVFDWEKRIFMPVEFSVAAYRFGHSMVRATYPLNSVKPDVPFFGGAEDMQGFRPLPQGTRSSGATARSAGPPRRCRARSTRTSCRRCTASPRASSAPMPGRPWRALRNATSGAGIRWACRPARRWRRSSV